ncbi:MAG: hypothetical protein E6Q97_30520 [Desulfurellales bacterium]|nr:MAG: hypothetical protein E6Q97_30520 [Desulfurellales bacterium]
MSGIYGLLGLEDGDQSYINTIGQGVVYEAASSYLQMVDEDMMKAYSVFIETETEKFKERYKLPGGGRMQQRGRNASNAAVRGYGGWNAAYPLKDFEEPVASDDVTLAYMTVEDVQIALDTIQIRNINTFRYEMLRVLFNNAQYTFPDDRNGDLTILPLANGDSVVYPPVMGSESEATENHYLESNYAASGISDTNNPYVTIRDELEEHFGAPSGFGSIAVFINTAQTAKTEDLTDFDPVEDRFVRSGDQRDIPTNLPSVPGRVIGRTNGVWVVEWRWIPSGWALGVDLDAPPPIRVRRDTVASGLQRGLHLAGDSEKHPLYSRHYRNRYGMGAGNRLNGVAMEFGTGGTYTVPTTYA